MATCCQFCGATADLLHVTGRGVRYLRGICRSCDNKRKGRAAKKSRADIANQQRWIVEDSRRSDKKHGRPNDMDREFVRNLIQSGCLYCGETSLRMTLDRIDNDKGHTRDNVVPACIRCNYARRDMPYEAWLIVAVGMRKARAKGLFKHWTGRVR